MRFTQWTLIGLVVAGAVAFALAPSFADGTDGGDTICVAISSAPPNTYIRIGMGDSTTGTLVTPMLVDGQSLDAAVTATWISPVRIEFVFDFGGGDGFNVGADMTVKGTTEPYSEFTTGDSFFGFGAYAGATGAISFTGSGSSVITRSSPAPDGPTILEWQLNGTICLPAERCECCEDGRRPAILTLQYTGDDCAASSNSQDVDQVMCSGDPAGAAQVRIVARGKAKGKKAAMVFHDDVVPLGGVFDVDAANANLAVIEPNTYFEIYDLAGNLLQEIRFHTSCSQPLNAGDQFGSLVVTGCVATVGGKKIQDKR